MAVGPVAVVRRVEASVEPEPARWTQWPVYWSAIWVGALAALALALLFGLTGAALGAHQAGAGGRIATWREISFGALLFSVLGAFLSFAAGGWIAGRIAGILRSETAMLNGAIVFLVALPLLLLLIALGAGNLFGSWWGGLAGTPAWVVPPGTLGPGATVPAVDPQAAAAARNGALAAATVLLLGLVGSVVGGWMASGEPMHPTFYRSRGRV